MNKLLVANWKLYKLHNNAIAWLNGHIEALDAVARETHTTVVLCPSYTELSAFAEVLLPTSIKLGAQNCATHLEGPYTGEISPASLGEIGCTYCIVGHHDRRVYYHETNEEVAAKVLLLLREDIIPIVCIGESAEDRKKKTTNQTFTKQLKPVLEAINKDIPPAIIHIAYEPWWAIGSGKTPTATDLATTLYSLEQYITEHAPQTKPYFLYGGSTDDQTIKHYADISILSGYLVGRASTDYVKLRAIIEQLNQTNP